MKMCTDGWTDKSRKNRQTNGQNYTVFELQSGNKNVDKQSDGQTNGQRTDGISPILKGT